VLGVLGVDIANLTGGVNVYAKPKTLGGTREATGRQNNIVAGMIIPVDISWTHPDDAVLSGQILVAHDGSANDPVIIADSVAIPANTDAERYDCGPWDLAGVTIENITALSIAFGLTVELKSADGDVWPTFYSITDIKPMIRITTRDVAHVKAAGIPLIGAAGTHAGTGNATVGYLRKRAAGGTHVAAATAQHIKFTLDGYVYCENILDASGPNDPDEVTLVAMGQYDGTNNPLKVTTGVAIP